MKKFKAVMFDMDGVMVDSMPLHFKAWQVFVARHQVAIGEEELRRLVDARRSAEIVDLLLGGRLSPADIQAGVDEKEVEYHALTAQELKEVPGARRLLEKIQQAGIPMAVVTAASEGNVQLVLDRMNFRKFFSVVVTARDVKLGKPDPEAYLKAAAELGVLPAECLVVEDALLGVQAAKASGAWCLAIKTAHSFEKLKESGADWVCDDLERIPAELYKAVFR